MVGIITGQEYMCICWDRFWLQYSSDSWCLDSAAVFLRPWSVVNQAVILNTQHYSFVFASELPVIQCVKYLHGYGLLQAITCYLPPLRQRTPSGI